MAESTYEVTLRTCQKPEETIIIQSVINRIYSLRRIALNMIFATGMTGALWIVRNSGEYVTPLLIISGLFTGFTWYLMLYFLVNKPKLIGVTVKNEGQLAIIRYQKDKILVQREKNRLVSYLPKSVIGQYWLDDYYILFFKDKGINDAVIVPIDNNTFVEIYKLANILHKKKIRFTKLKTKKEKV